MKTFVLEVYMYWFSLTLTEHPHALKRVWCASLSFLIPCNLDA